MSTPQMGKCSQTGFMHHTLFSSDDDDDRWNYHTINITILQSATLFKNATYISNDSYTLCLKKRPNFETV